MKNTRCQHLPSLHHQGQVGVGLTCNIQRKHRLSMRLCRGVKLRPPVTESTIVMEAAKQGDETRLGEMGSSSRDVALHSTSDPTSAVPPKSVILVSMDGDTFEVEASALKTSEVIRRMVDGENCSHCCASLVTRALPEKSPAACGFKVTAVSCVSPDFHRCIPVRSRRYRTTICLSWVYTDIDDAHASNKTPGECGLVVAGFLIDWSINCLRRFSMCATTSGRSAHSLHISSESPNA